MSVESPPPSLKIVPAPLQVLANPTLDRLQLKKHGIFFLISVRCNEFTLYLCLVPCLLKNGPNSNKVGKGHILHTYLPTFRYLPKHGVKTVFWSSGR